MSAAEAIRAARALGVEVTLTAAISYWRPSQSRQPPRLKICHVTKQRS